MHTAALQSAMQLNACTGWQPKGCCERPAFGALSSHHTQQCRLAELTTSRPDLPLCIRAAGQCLQGLHAGILRSGKEFP